MNQRSKPIKIAVIGTLCWDKIILPDGSITEGFGGMAYTILTLAALLRSKAELYPVCLIGKDKYEEARQLLDKFRSVIPDGIIPVDQPNNQVTLTYIDSQTREEILEGGVPAIKFDQVKGILDCDYVLVNFISGWDIELEALQKLKRESQAKIYLDLHSLTLGMDEWGKRYLRKPAEWKKYLACCDFLQLNLRELETLSEKTFTAEEAEEKLMMFLDLGPQIAAVTLAERGCLLAYRTQEGTRVSTRMETNPVNPARDTTGCGDVFGAGFLAKFIATKDPEQAADFGNQLAGLKAAFSGVEGLCRIKPLDLESA